MSYVTARQLEVFAAAAETLSFARVAEQMRLTPSAVSFQIRQIELQIGLPLFERIGRGVRLTEAGRVALDFSRPVLRGLRDLDTAMQRLKQGGGGRVTLGLVSTAKYIIPHLIARFRRENPNVEVALREGNRSQIVDLLLSGGVDLAIIGQPPAGCDILAEPFASHPSVVVAAPGHVLCGRGPLRSAALRHEWFIMREEGSGTRSLADQVFKAAGFVPLVAMETSSNEMIKQAVMAEMGLAILSQHTIRLETAVGLLAVLPVEGFPVLRSWFVAQRRTALLLPGQAALRAFLVAHGQTMIDEPVSGPAVPNGAAACGAPKTRAQSADQAASGAPASPVNNEPSAAASGSPSGEPRARNQRRNERRTAADPGLDESRSERGRCDSNGRSP